jgi:homoserine O-succinyltransferase
VTATLNRSAAAGRAAAPDGPPRIGIVNLMPHAEQYERWLWPQLAASPRIEPILIRVDSRKYGLDDAGHIGRAYRRYADVVDGAPLDGLIVSGAAVEHLPYEEVRFLPEVEMIVRLAAAERTPILGLCWGALAVAHLLFGLPKEVYRTKVAGVFQTDRLVDDGPIAMGLDDRFWTAHSRFAGFDDKALDASGTVRAVARSAQAGTVIAESRDHGVVMHIGHPEYTANRLVDEYRRDLALRLDGVSPPANVDLDHPVNQWRSHSLIFFASWVRLVRQRSCPR